MADTQTELQDLLSGDIEPLDPELRAHLQQTSIGPMIRHPLLYSLFHHDALNRHTNACFRHKLAELAEAEERRAYDKAVWLHERPYRADALARYAGLDGRARMTDRDYWELVAAVWVDSENIREQPRLWDRLLHDPRGSRDHLMDDDERAALASLPDMFTIWQGHTTERDDGWSWTTEESTAIWFAQRFANLERSRPALSRSTVSRDKVAAYLLRRGEHEILVDPAALDGITTIELRNTPS